MLWVQYRPIGRILVPVADPAYVSGLVLYLIVPDTQLIGSRHLSHSLNNYRMMNKLSKVSAGLEDIYDLPCRVLIVLSYVGQ